MIGVLALEIVEIVEKRAKYMKYNPSVQYNGKIWAHPSSSEDQKEHGPSPKVWIKPIIEHLGFSGYNKVTTEFAPDGQPSKIAERCHHARWIKTPMINYRKQKEKRLPMRGDMREADMKCR